MPRRPYKPSTWARSDVNASKWTTPRPRRKVARTRAVCSGRVFGPKSRLSMRQATPRWRATRR